MKIFLNLLWCKLFISSIQKNSNGYRSPKVAILFAFIITHLVVFISCSDDYRIQPEPGNPLCLLDSMIYKVSYNLNEHRFHYTYIGDKIEKIVYTIDNNTEISHFYYSDNQLDSIQTYKDDTNIRSVIFVREKNLIYRYEIKRDDWDGNVYMNTKQLYHINSRNEAEKFYSFTQYDPGNWVKDNNYQKFTWKNGNMVMLEIYKTNNKKSDDKPHTLLQYMPGWSYVNETHTNQNTVSQNYSGSNQIKITTGTYTYDKMRNPVNIYPFEASLDLGWLNSGRNNLTSVHFIHQNDDYFGISYSYEYDEKKFPVIRIGHNPTGYSDTILYYYSFR